MLFRIQAAGLKVVVKFKNGGEEEGGGRLFDKQVLNNGIETTFWIAIIKRMEHAHKLNKRS
jgi:hypothetical protein